MRTLAFLALVLQLGHPDYAKREKASCQLRAMMPAAYPALAWAVKHKDAEIAVRAKWVLQEWRDKDLLAFLEKWQPTPWIDMLPKDWPDRGNVVSIYLGEANSRGVQQGPKDWPNYRLATKIWAMENYRHTWGETGSREKLNATLTYMEAEGKCWWERVKEMYSGH